MSYVQRAFEGPPDERSKLNGSVYEYGTRYSSSKSVEELHSSSRYSHLTSTTGCPDCGSSIASTDVDPKADSVTNEASSHQRRDGPPPYVKSLSPAERTQLENALVRKIDIRLIPTIILMYILNYLDRTNIASARLAGLESDLGLYGTQYETCVAIFFVGYLLMQVPSNLFLSKVGKPSLYLPVCMIVWGTLSAVTSRVHSFGGLLAVRFLLGFVEAPYCDLSMVLEPVPGCLYFLSAWYTRKELALRTAMLLSGSLISGAFSGLLAAAITRNLDGVKGLSAWRWLFIIEGSVTILVAVCAVFVLPDFPRTTNWLTEDERQLAIWRLDEDVGEDDWESRKNQHFTHGFVLAFKDIKTWIMMVMTACIAFAGSVTNFFPTVVQTLGYGRIESLLLTAPPYVLGVITALTNAWHADRSGERYLHVTLPLYFAAAAFILAAATTATGPRYFSMMLMVPGINTGLVVALGWISNCMPRPPAKRAAALAFINAVSNTSSIFTAYMFAPSFGPRYVLAMSLCSCAAFMAVVCATILRATLVRLNHKLDRGEYVEHVSNHGGTIAGGTVISDFRFLI